VRFPVDPMKAGIGSLPPDDGTWAYEIKWDGYRTLAFIDNGSLRLQSSSGLDVTTSYPELHHLPTAVNATSAVLDGELVVLDANGRPSFEAIQRHQTQAALYLFDVLSINGTDIVSLPYRQRRELLEHLVEAGSNWMVPAYRVGEGAALLEAAEAQRLEGVMAKKLDSPYQPGKRSPHWRKVKVRVTETVVIGGYTAGSGNRAGTFGALLIGVEEPDGRLRFAGGVGTGFNQRRLESLTTMMRQSHAAECPFDPVPPREVCRTATWVQPIHHARIELAEFTNDGLARHASFIDLVD
jgi:bifunctional non-homologous end joining protein LigD